MSLASVFANLRQSFGQKIVWNGSSYAAIVDSVPAKELADIPEASSLNAANSDLRYVSLSPADFLVAGRPVYPSEEQTIQINDSGVPREYTILRAPVRMLQGQPIKVRLMVYRTPAPDSAGAETAAEAAAITQPQDAGQRRQYSPPPSTL